MPVLTGMHTSDKAFEMLASGGDARRIDRLTRRISKPDRGRAPVGVKFQAAYRARRLAYGWKFLLAAITGGPSPAYDPVFACSRDEAERLKLCEPRPPVQEEQTLTERVGVSRAELVEMKVLGPDGEPLAAPTPGGPDVQRLIDLIRTRAFG